MTVLYMTVFMKSNPTLEGALRFAANNVSGKVGKDLKTILWEVESGQYNTVEESLNNYLLEWKEYNKEFVESILLIRESMLESSASRREALLDKAIDIILVGTDEKMKKYARELETPIMVLEGLGILLPVMGMIVFPLITIFLADEMQNIGLYLAIGYDVILPALVYFFMDRTLQQRPATHTKIDISKHPDYVAGNNVMVRFMGKEESVPALPLAVSVALIFMLPGINYLFATDFYSKGEHGIFSMLMSVSIVFALALGGVVYNYAASFQKIGLRRRISQIESEFEDALFALGSRLSGGTPIESAIKAAERDTKELEISDMFRILLKNINRLSMTFKDALFDEKYGALQYYPSALVTTIMKAISESVEKGTRAASMSMLTISRYLRDIRSTQERIENLLSSIVSSLKFQSFVLIPVMSAVVVAVAQLIIQILINLGTQFRTLQGTMPSGAEGLSIAGIFPTGSAVAAETLQLIVGIYVVEILTIMGSFITRIEFGHDEIEEHDTTWRLLIFGMAIYTIVLLIVMAVFSPLIKAVSMGVG
ncbi:Type II secretion system (T2SS), protein F [uncultured archaeon]|nr:Type II secretion system (T2SS), protein F [uncultured archaeon]